MPEFETTQRDATNVGPQIPPEEQARQDAIAEAHINAGIDHFTDVGKATAEGAAIGFVTGVGTGPAGGLIGAVGGGVIGGNVGQVKGVWNNCFNCHNLLPGRPTLEPPVPEIDTEEEEKKREERLKELSGNP